MGEDHPQKIAYYDQILLSERFVADHQPDVIFQIGGPSVSKRLATYIRETTCAHVASLHSHDQRQDPEHRVTLDVEANIEKTCHYLSERLQPSSTPPWVDRWKKASNLVAQRLEDILIRDTMNEATLAQEISRLIPPSHALMLASSMPVRDMDMYGLPTGRPVPVMANRGASGIDGTLATAAGIGKGLHVPVTVVVGDLALLHDINSLHLLHQVDLPLIVVVINNNGGGIFHFLPIAKHNKILKTTMARHTASRSNMPPDSLILNMHTRINLMRSKCSTHVP